MVWNLAEVILHRYLLLHADEEGGEPRWGPHVNPPFIEREVFIPRVKSADTIILLDCLRECFHILLLQGHTKSLYKSPTHGNHFVKNCHTKGTHKLVFIGEQWLKLNNVCSCLDHILSYLSAASEGPLPHSKCCDISVTNSIAKTITLISLASLLSPKAGYCSSYLILMISSIGDYSEGNDVQGSYFATACWAFNASMHRWQREALKRCVWN